MMSDEGEPEQQDAERQHFLRDCALDNIQQFCLKAENTTNPLFFWKALSAWFDANVLGHKLGLEPIEMPDQIRTYLAVAAKRLSDLSRGLDYRQTPEPFGELSRNWESVEVARERTPTLSAARATTLAFYALGLRRDGRNAFERAMALDEQDVDALTQEMYVTIGNMGEGESMESILDDHAVAATSQGESIRALETVRGLRKRIKASRDARRPG